MAGAQTAPVLVSANSSSSAAAFAALPDAPDAPALRAAVTPDAGYAVQASANVAPKWATVIEPGETAVRYTAGDKFLYGFRGIATPASIGGILISAGYSQITNGRPNYGTDRGAFGQRLGAAGLGTVTESVFSSSILAPVFHTDPRYYRMGPQHGFGGRVLYAVGQTFLTRTDGGHTTLNAPVLIGYAGSSAMTALYYPDINHNGKDIAENYLSSLGGVAAGNLVSEFLGPLFQKLHLEPKR